MKKTVSLFCVIILFFTLSARQIEPMKMNIGRLNIFIDPRMELLGAIQIAADYKDKDDGCNLVTKNTPYSNEVKAYFESMKKSEAVELTNKLVENYGFNYDSPVTFMLYLSQPRQLKEVISYSEYLIRRAGGKDNLRLYRDAIYDFAKKSDFEQFWNSKKEFYNQILSLTYEQLKDMDPVKLIEEYYKDSCNSYNMVLCPLFGNCNYGPKIELRNGKQDIYSLVCTTNTKDGIPYFNKRGVEHLILHEFSHSFVNPLTEKYRDKVNLSEKLFEPIKNKMSNMAYTNWETSLNEHIIRAVIARITEIVYGEKSADNVINKEKSQGFIYVEPIIEKLKEFEKFRDADGITFAEYFPNILSVLEELKPSDLVFNGNINQVFSADKIAIVYPTADCDQEIMRKIKQYTTQIAGFLKQGKNKESIVISDSIALNMSLDEYGILCYGTMDNNLFLSHNKNTLPFQIENGVLFADKEYRDPDLIFITCVPNPQNNKRGMIIYTALKSNNIININNYSHGSCDYHIFNGGQTALTEGYYSKKSTLWKFWK